MSKELATTSKAVEQLELIAQEYGPQALAPLSAIARTFKLAQGVQQTRTIVAQVTPHVRHLAGTPLGFVTDKDKNGGYPDSVITECLMEAVLRGVSWVGNQFNILSGKFYITKEGYQRLVREIAGLTDLVLMPGMPKGFDGGAVVPYKATWKLHNKPMSLERQIPVRLNNGMGADGAIGKATRKMLASIYFTCTGSEQSASDALDDAPEAGPVGPTRAEASAAKIEQKAALFDGEKQQLPD